MITETWGGIYLLPEAFQPGPRCVFMCCPVAEKIPDPLGSSDLLGFVKPIEVSLVLHQTGSTNKGEFFFRGFEQSEFKNKGLTLPETNSKST